MISLIFFIWFLGWLISFGTIRVDLAEERPWFVFGSVAGLILVWPIWLGWLWRDMNE